MSVKYGQQKGVNNMSRKFLLVDVNILPEDFKKVAKVKELLKNEKCSDIKEAIDKVGTNEELYNQYCDYIFELATETFGKEVVLSLILNHQAGVLSNLLVELANAKTSVLTISQEAPKEGEAIVSLKIDISELNIHLDDLLAQLKKLDGVKKVNLEAIE